MFLKENETSGMHVNQWSMVRDHFDIDRNLGYVPVLMLCEYEYKIGFTQQDLIVTPHLGE